MAEAKFRSTFFFLSAAITTDSTVYHRNLSTDVNLEYVIGKS